LRNSIRICQIFGISVRVHHLFLWMMAGVLLIAPQLALQFGLLFILVLLHELGHSVVAQRFGIRVLDITLWPLGGLARMSDIPQDSRTEATIAIAGPAVNIGLALLSLPVLVLTAASPVVGFVFWFFWMNLVLGVFNLLPAFPMDGGRILRAYLGRNSDWVSATTTAVRVGRWVALGMVGLWIFNMSAVMLPIIAIFIWITGTKELVAVRLRNGQMPFAFANMGASGSNGQGGSNPLADMFGAFQRQAAAGQARQQQQQQQHEQARPAESGPEPEPGSSDGFSEREIEALERFHGRLRAPRDES
jgi:Zn-dependent protease